ncbi:MAG: hypothetical protein ABWW66_08150 [Archaeoglobaceae archaeon]
MIVELQRIARSKDWKPWELQEELRKVYSDVVAVGDDLSFTVRLPEGVEVNEEAVKQLGGVPCRIYPFKKAYRFGKEFIAFEGRFLRVSRNLDERIIEAAVCWRS